ncbi:MAG: osmotically inducible protein C [Betaproteobacteria bacterium HGW-Betaproteobacteria-16]|nr:MAG: osmotically inducible protein C [Betaproteobacteria bacterium HGW-Betaproteobacteria-16]
MQSERFEFTGHDGSLLAARLDLPEGPVRASAILAHCFTCSKDIPAARRIAGRLAARGIAVLRFDFTGLGHSGGEFANTNFSSNVEDLHAAVNALAKRGMSPQLLIGHSLGGAAVLKAAPDVKGLRAVVTVGAPADPSHVVHHMADQVEHIRREGSAMVQLAGRPFEIRRQFLEDISAHSIETALTNLRAALLVMHAPNDLTVGIDQAARIFMAAKHPKSFVSLDTADHLVSREEDAEYVAEVISGWSARYLDPAPATSAPGAPEGVVRVAESQAGGFKQDVTINARHQLVADEPLSVGGTDLGPSPYQLLSAGLGACTTMTLRMYANLKKIPLTHVTCDVTHNKAHLEDIEQLGAGNPKVDVFTRRIRLEGELTVEQQEALLRIADKCPVHQTLHGQALVQTELVTAAGH